MLMFLVVAFGVLTLAVMSIGAMVDMDIGAKDDWKVVAGQMAIYHAAAGRTCATTPCAKGQPINVTGSLASFRQNKGIFADGRITSYAIQKAVGEDYIVTVLTGGNKGLAESRGSVRAAFSGMVPLDTSVWAGVMDKAGKKVRVDGQKTWRESPTSTVTYLQVAQEITVPDALSSAADKDAPALISRW